ncbi:MAG: carbohydrate ABC transporter substrate-binding protein [Verrucomicrobia bacterium]|nr:carbohydrate ABC transporter substrate-binding protein [Verrucomicrobiota bacterium]
MSGSDRSYVGITWDHPRGYNALSEASRGLEKKDSPISVHWEKQSLEEFESRPIEDLCARYDLVVMDHPHLGAAVGRNCLQPLNDWLPGDRIKRIARTSIGSTFQSYYYEGKYWALPLDAATQVMALRLDLLGSRSIPITWDEVLQLANNLSVVLSVGGPHALVTFFSICVALGEPPTSLDPAIVTSETTGGRALELMQELTSRMSDPELDLNPIQISERMTQTDEVACCPLIYGYVNYADPRAYQGKSLTFMGAPMAYKGGRHGSTLGGTGLAVSRRTRICPELIEYLLWLVSDDAQRTLIPDFNGQPSAAAAWSDPDLNRRWNGFYKNTFETIQDAWIRPRHPGYIEFQSEGSAIIRSGLRRGKSTGEMLQSLQDAYARSHSLQNSSQVHPKT